MTKVSTPAGIVAKIMAALKLGEEGKIGSFFNKLESDFNRQIKTIQHNLSGEELTFAQNLEALEEQLEDAISAVENAWMDVTAEAVANNALQDSYKDCYLHNISVAEAKVESIQASIKYVKEAHERTVKDLNEQIEKYQARLARIKV